MSATSRNVALAAVLSGAACASVAWHEPTSTATWRGAALRTAEHAGVVAVSESEASEVYRFYAEIVTAMDTAGLGTPSPPLLIVVETDHRQLLGDEAATRAAIGEWYPDAESHGPPPSEGEAPPFDLVLAMIVLQPPIDTPRLELPTEWQQRYHTAFLVASDSCVDDVADRLFDLGMEREQVNWAQRLLIAPFRPKLRGMLRGMLREQHRLLLLGALLPEQGVDATALEACVESLGMSRDAAGRVIRLGGARSAADHRTDDDVLVPRSLSTSPPPRDPSRCR